LRDDARDATPYLAAKGLPAVIGLAFTVAAINLTSPEAYARATIAYAIAQGVALLSATWAAQAVLRESGVQGAMWKVAPSRVLAGMGTSAAGIASAVVVFALSWPAGNRALFFVLLAAAWPISIVGQAGLQASQRATAFALGEVVRSTLPLTILALGWFVGGVDETWLLAAWASGAVGTFLFALTIQGPPRRYVSSTSVTASLRFGGPIALWAVLGVVLAFADRVILAMSLGEDVAGQYAAAYDVLVRGASLVIAPLVLAFHPRFMSAVNQGAYEASFLTWRRFLRTSTALTVLYVVLVVSFAKPLSELMLDGAELSLPTMALLAFGGGLAQVALIAHKPDEAAGATFAMLARLATVSAVNVGANLALVPSYGEPAAAATTAASFAVYVVWTLSASRKHQLPVP
jgi:O-antigen/teichoic acid export membrane protein